MEKSQRIYWKLVWNTWVSPGIFFKKSWEPWASIFEHPMLLLLGYLSKVGLFAWIELYVECPTRTRAPPQLWSSQTGRASLDCFLQSLLFSWADLCRQDIGRKGCVHRQQQIFVGHCLPVCKVNDFSGFATSPLCRV